MENIDLPFLLLGLFILLALSFLFSGSETALTAVSRARIHALEREGNRRAIMVGKLREEKEKLIGTILIANNLVNNAASALAATAALTLFGYEGVAIATLALTLLLIIFSEVLPKTYAIQNSERTALAIAPFILLLTKLLYPVTTVVYA